MASFSSSSPSTGKYCVYISFYGGDVPPTFFSHLRKKFESFGITMFDDNEREDSNCTDFTKIRESIISIVVLSMNYASDRVRLDQLWQILKCKEDMGQIVIPVFYGVYPSVVQKKKGDFGRAFRDTCYGRATDETEGWSQALEDVGNIPGKYLINRDHESKMIEMIARDISNKLNTTISRDFGDMVGLDTHLEKIQSLLHLEKEDEAMIVGICGPAGIGKTTIARALYSRLSCSFRLSCFMENLRGSYNSGLDDFGLKQRLQEQFLSKIFNHNGMRISHLGIMEERLRDQKVLIILDGVNDIRQLEALANETKWHSGSKMIEKIARDILTITGHRYSTGMEFVVVINLAVEITSAVLEHLSSIRMPYLAIITISLSILSIVLSGLDLFYKIRAHRARFRCKWPIPWFYYPAPGYNTILGNFTDTVLLFCAVGGFIVSMVNWSYIKRGQEGPIKALVVWPLSFAFGMAGMVVYNNFIKGKLANSKDYSPLNQRRTDD